MNTSFSFIYDNYVGTVYTYSFKLFRFPTFRLSAYLM
jgi:hypothetical protein